MIPLDEELMDIARSLWPVNPNLAYLTAREEAMLRIVCRLIATVEERERRHSKKIQELVATTLSNLHITHESISSDSETKK